MSTPRFEVIDVSKRFPGVQALSGVSLQLADGEVLAVIGENGAGKSTLMKIMAGVHAPDSGTLRVEGREVRFGSPADAIAAGIALIHQELNLADNLTVAENIFLGREPARGGVIRRREMARRAAEYLDRVGLGIAPETRVDSLSVAHQQLIEIAGALSAEARVLIMDEPTSSLTTREAERLFRVVDQLRAQGVSIVYISHRLAEVQRLADRVEILRDGENAARLPRDGITHDAMVRGMVGRDLDQFFPHTSHPVGRARLSVDGLVVKGSAGHAVGLEVRAGEIVALAGLVGAGRSELLETIFGIRPATAGSVRVDDQPIRSGSPRAAMDAGLALVPEDRKSAGLVVEMTVEENLSLASLADYPAAPRIDAAAEHQQAERLVAELGIRTPSLEASVVNLSGGNQQKVALGKWLARSPKVLLLDEPTRGVDIGAKHEIYAIMERLAEQGMAILYASSEMEEVLGMADRVIVMHEGAVTGVLAREQLDEETVMRLAVAPPAEQPTAAGSTPAGPVRRKRSSQER